MFTFWIFVGVWQFDNAEVCFRASLPEQFVGKDTNVFLQLTRK